MPSRPGRHWPSPLRSTGRPSPGLGLRCEEGRGSFEQIALLLEADVLAPELAQLVALIRRKAVVAFVAIELILPAPVAERLLRDAETLGELARRAAGAQHLHRLAAELLGIRGSRLGHGDTILSRPTGASRQVSGKPGPLQSASRAAARRRSSIRYRGRPPRSRGR